jgi:wyosine [tRNA(Phe)-imidazoG37] synthetase (radical SAM superfamily)
MNGNGNRQQNYGRNGFRLHYSCRIRRPASADFSMPRQPILLDTSDHNRASAGMRYVYPVLSRRAGGISVGINLNPNNACNWRCIYCQVPDLTRGGPPPIDLALLENELSALLEQIQAGQFLGRAADVQGHTAKTLDAADPFQQLADIAFSGNGEPTSAAEFPAAVAIAQRVLAARGLAEQVKLRLITNGSLLDRPGVQAGIAQLGQAGGEVWFKLDTATPAGLAKINGTRANPAAIARRLARCATLATTWVQSCFFLLDEQPPTTTELEAYLALLMPLTEKLAGVHLYSLARPSLQPEAPRLRQMDLAALEHIARRLRQLGLNVRINP